MGADLVAVENLDAQAAPDQLVTDRLGQRRLTGTRQPCEPQRQTRPGDAHAPIRSIRACATSARVNSVGEISRLALVSVNTLKGRR
jgi:hypothetical protein